MSNINKIKLSGTTYNIQDENACKVVELTQAQYDALPATAKTSNSLFVITDATAGDLSNYYTKSETDDLLDTKLDASAYTPTDLSNYYTKSETSGATEISTALASKQDTLVSGTNIKTINNESILGEGNITIEGGVSESVFTSYSAATNARISEDEEVTAAALNDLNEALSGKADTSSVYTKSEVDTALNAKQDTLVSGTNIKTINNESILGSGNITIEGGGGKAVSAGTNISVTTGETADTINCTLPIETISNSYGVSQIYVGDNIYKNNNYSAIVIASKDDSSTGETRVEFANGAISIGSTNNVFHNGIAIGKNATAGARNSWGHIAIGTNVKATGSTKTNINNQIKVDTSNQVYISNSANTSTYCLQEKIENTESALGGLKLVKLTQSEYDALSPNYDSNTLYVIVN